MRPTPRVALRFALGLHMMAFAAGAESLPALDRNTMPSPQTWGALPRTPRPDDPSGSSVQTGPVDAPSHDAEALADADAPWSLGRALTGRPGAAASLRPRLTGVPAARGSSGASPPALDDVWRRLALGDEGTPLAEPPNGATDTHADHVISDLLPPPDLLYRPDSRLFSTDPGASPTGSAAGGPAGAGSGAAPGYAVVVLGVVFLALGLLTPLIMRNLPLGKRRKKRRRRSPRRRAES